MRILLSVLQMVLLLAGMQAGAAQAAVEEIYLGSVAMDVPAAMVVRLKPLVQYLSSSTGLKVTFRASPNMDAAAGDLGNDFTQIAYLTPVAYLDAHEKYGAIPIAAPLIQGRSTFRLVVVVRQDSAFKTMNDLHGQSFAFGDEKALLQRAVVAGGGVSLGSLSRYAFLKHYDNIAKAVLNKDFDAGILKDSIADEFQGKGLRVIYASPPLPSYLFAVNSRLPEATVNKLRQALLALKLGNPGQMKVLKSLDERYSGFGPVDDKDYDVIRKLIAPFK